MLSWHKTKLKIQQWNERTLWKSVFFSILIIILPGKLLPRSARACRHGLYRPEEMPGMLQLGGEEAFQVNSEMSAQQILMKG